ncbi:Hypothetical protein, partial CDS, partial [Neorhizobium galegae bv. orientalis]
MYTRHWALDRRLRAFQDTVSAHNVHSLRKAWSVEGGGLSLFCRRSQYSSEESGCFKCRMIEMRIACPEQTVAIALFHEWCLTEGYFPGDEHFIRVADAVTQQDYEMAEFISGCWDEDDHPLYYGNIVLFDRLSITTPHPDAWPLMLKGIDRQFSK